MPSSPVEDLRSFIDERLHARSTHVYAETVRAVESLVLARVLQFTNGNLSATARILGLSRTTLRRKIRTNHIHVGSVVFTGAPGQETSGNS